MIEQLHKINTSKEKLIEKVIEDDHVHYMHMIFNKEEGLPEHFSNSNVYMTVLRGTLSIGLDDQEIHRHEAGSVLKIPLNTKMNVGNKDEGQLELIVIKAPAPQK